MSDWWEIRPGYPIHDTGEVIDEDRKIWFCGTCSALVVAPRRHIDWHESLDEPKAVSVVIDADSIMSLATKQAKEERA